MRSSPHSKPTGDGLECGMQVMLCYSRGMRAISDVVATTMATMLIDAGAWSFDSRLPTRVNNGGRAQPQLACGL